MRSVGSGGQMSPEPPPHLSQRSASVVPVRTCAQLCICECDECALSCERVIVCMRVRNSGLQSAFVPHVLSLSFCVCVCVCVCSCKPLDQCGILFPLPSPGSSLSCPSGPKPDDTHSSGVCLHSVTQDCVGL